MTSPESIDTAQEETLGAFVRAMRERSTPTAFGLDAGRRRRTRGLRREEVAALCGISTTWYTWIEQNRAGPVSAHTLSDLATGLRLSAAERAYLFRLGRRMDPQPPLEGGALPASPQALVHAIAYPAYLLDSIWNVLAANAPAHELFGPWIVAVAQPTPNLLRYVFLDEQAPERIADWHNRARRIVAEYRADSAGRDQDPAHRSLIDALVAASPAFAEAWHAREVQSREGGRRSFRHPRLGEVSYWQYTWRSAQQERLKLVVLQPESVDGQTLHPPSDLDNAGATSQASRPSSAV